MFVCVCMFLCSLCNRNTNHDFLLSCTGANLTLILDSAQSNTQTHANPNHSCCTTIFCSDELLDDDEDHEEFDDAMYEWVGDGRSHSKSNNASKHASMEDLNSIAANDDAAASGGQIEMSQINANSANATAALEQVSPQPNAANVPLGTSAGDSLPPPAPGNIPLPRSAPRAGSRPSRSSFSTDKDLRGTMRLVRDRALEVGCAPIRIRAAMALNMKMKEMSSEAALIVTNLPLTLKTVPLNFMGYIDSLTEDLPAILMLKPGEAVTMTAVG